MGSALADGTRRDIRNGGPCTWKCAVTVP
jgi:hypothetical protein